MLGGVSMNKQEVKSRLEKILGKLFENGRHVVIYLTIYDLVMINLSYLAALWIRFDCRFGTIPAEYIGNWKHFVPIYSIFCLMIFYGLKLYQSIWKYASYNELVRVSLATVITVAFHAVVMGIFFGRMPVTYYAFGALLQFTFTLAVRFSYRFISLERTKKNSELANSKVIRFLLIGAGQAGRIILRDMNISNRETRDKVVCIIDDNPNKQRRYMDGIPVIGGRECILDAVKKYDIDKIVVAIPSATSEQKRDIFNICKETGCEIKNLPGVCQLETKVVSAKELKEVAIEDLLGREPIKVNMNEIYENIKGKVILVTGVGSIGSEICRQIAAHNPRKLIMFDIYENNLYEIQQELIRTYANLDLVTEVGSVRDSRRVNYVFEKYRPEMVYHAAAHKHVPLMEGNPNEAIKNNTIGTYKTAYAAMMNGCKKFVLISTDKAVNPTNIMGASKRMCEMIIQSFDRMVKEGRVNEIPKLFSHIEDEDGKIMKFDKIPSNVSTEFVAVRFGNVLGSNGSVIPLFKKQIEEGGPVTVTHPDIIRYFMTIPEAVSLVLQAGTYAKGGEIFILDMGSPVKIEDLARNLIKLSGLRPDEDIKLEYIGLRPGEKLYEEKLMAEEGLTRTQNKLIHIAKPIEFSVDEFFMQLEKLVSVVYDENMDIKECVKEIVSTYTPYENEDGKESCFLEPKQEAGEYETENKDSSKIAKVKVQTA